MAGLDKVNGEELAGLGRGKPVPAGKWADVVQMGEVAGLHAAKRFNEKGAALPITFSEENVLVMEYHFSSKVVWLFCMNIHGQEHYADYTFTLGPEIIPELVVANKWPAVYLPNYRQ